MSEFTFGGISFPLQQQPSGKGLLQVADPALKIVRDFLASAIDHYLGSSLVAAAADAGVDNIKANVAERYCFNVALYGQVERPKFPYVSIWRESSQNNERTVNWDQSVSTWSFAYVLPPLNPAQIERVGPALNSISKIVAWAIRNKAHPAYQNGANALQLAGLASLTCLSDEFAAFQFPGNDGTEGPMFPSVVFKLQAVERVMPDASNLPDFTGINTTLTENSDGTDTAVVLQTRTDLP